MSISFVRYGLNHQTICLIDYHKYWVIDENGERVKNPKFDVRCGQLLDVKDDPTGRNYRTSVSAFGTLLANTLKDHPLLKGYVNLDIAIVPKSEAGRVSPGLIAVAQRLETLDKRFNLPRPQILTRIKTIAKLHSGGNRAISVHVNSIDATIKPQRLKGAILLLDDIGTTGNSIVACTELLYAAGAGRVFPVVLGRTT